MDTIPVHAKYKEYLPRWRKWRDATAGEEAIKAGKETYLPRLAEQTDAEYKDYLGLASYYNATGKTVAALSGVLSFRPAAVALPPDLTPLENGGGRKGLTAQLKQAKRELCVVGRCGLLGEVDAEKLPAVYLYQTESIVNWFLDEDCNLQWVVLLEAKAVMAGPMQQETVPQWRLLAIIDGAYTQIVYRKEKGTDGKETLVGSPPIIPVNRDGQPLDFIPFVFLDYEGDDGEEGEVGASPIADLAAVNISHYQLNAELRHLLRLTACPMLAISGLAKKDQKDTLIVGSSTVIYLPSDGSAAYAEVSGAGAGVIREELVRIEDQMSRLGVSSLRAGKADAETAESIKLQQKGESSVLSTVADVVTGGFTRMARLLARWYGLDDKAQEATKIEVSKEFFDTSLSIPEAEFLFKLYMQGSISLEDLLESLQGGGVLSESIYQRALENARKQATNGTQAKINDGAGSSDRKSLQEDQ